jgi:hypothetical protein
MSRTGGQSLSLRSAVNRIVPSYHQGVILSEGAHSNTVSAAVEGPAFRPPQVPTAAKRKVCAAGSVATTPRLFSAHRAEVFGNVTVHCSSKWPSSVIQTLATILVSVLTCELGAK